MTPPEPVRRLRLSMVGGGQGAFIGAVHRMAIRLDGQAEVVAGAFASTPERSLDSARELGLSPDRSYSTWQEMLVAERGLGPSERLDAIVIVTPNHTHFEIASAFVDAGFNVLCDKPLVTRVEDALTLSALVARRGVRFAVSYNYSGYPMVREMRSIIADGQLGTIRKVIAEYHQGWLSTDLAAAGHKQASWRGDPALAGAGALGDIATHAEQLVVFTTGLTIESLAADLRSVVPGRQVDDDALIRLRFIGGATGYLSVSQVCVGEENGLTLRVFGEHGTLVWAQEHPNQLRHARGDGSVMIRSRGDSASGPAARLATRLPPGHPEGFIEAFANIYQGFFAAIRGQPDAVFPSIADGVRGVRFVERALTSARHDGGWMSFE